MPPSRSLGIAAAALPVATLRTPHAAAAPPSATLRMPRLWLAQSGEMHLRGRRRFGRGLARRLGAARQGTVRRAQQGRKTTPADLGSAAEAAAAGAVACSRKIAAAIAASAAARLIRVLSSACRSQTTPCGISAVRHFSEAAARACLAPTASSSLSSSLNLGVHALLLISIRRQRRPPRRRRWEHRRVYHLRRRRPASEQAKARQQLPPRRRLSRCLSAHL